MNKREYEFKKWNLEFRKTMWEDMIDSNKTMWKTDVLLLVMIAVVVIFCSVWGAIQFIEGRYFFAVLEFVLVITNVGSGVITVKRMIRVRKRNKWYIEKVEELDREYLELLEKENELGYDEIQ